MTIKSALDKHAEAKIHSEVLQELGTSAEAEIAPHTIELENETVRLTGTVDAQYTELRQDPARDLLQRTRPRAA